VDERTAFISTFRVADEERLRFLALSLKTTTGQLDPGRYGCHVFDASPEPFASEARALFEAAGFAVLHYQQGAATMPEAWNRL